jgi:ribose/xylose/arabinose/galactoside ABC-type transport system permease subunit
MDDPFLFQSIAAIVIGGVCILGAVGISSARSPAASPLVVLLSVLRAENTPEGAAMSFID